MGGVRVPRREEKIANLMREEKEKESREYVRE
jgi:hypothetical protein